MAGNTCLNFRLFTVRCAVVFFALNESQSNGARMYVFMFNIPKTAKVIWRGGHSFKSHPTDW